MNRGVQYALVVFITAGILLGGSVVSAQVDGDSVERRRRELQKQLDVLQAEIEEQEVFLRQKQSESVSLERDIAILDAEINRAKLSIQQRDLTIQSLTGQIGQKETKIVNLTEKMKRERDSLAQLLRKTNEIDNVSLVEIILGKQDLSEFFEDLDAFAAIKLSLQESFVEIENTKSDTHAEKVVLEDTRSQELELRELQELEKQKIERQEAEKQRLLDVSRGEEARYQSIIASIEKSAAQIRAELFTLRGSAAIPFGEALDLANAASAKTGVRPALILGVIEEESRLGEFLGTGNWRTDMHPTRDQPVFQQIMAELGLDPDRMPVSKAPSYGWGGAMGPAQFIPSTWILYKDRIAKLTGHNPPNPYDPEDAFMATALLMGDNGADRGTYAAERLAALRYFAGWKNAENPAYAFYGNEVMALAEKNQNLIDKLAGS